MKKEYIEQGGKYHTKKAIIYNIISNYEHDYQAEGNAISKRRLWYILKPVFSKSVMPVYKKKGEYFRREPICNQDYNKYYNELSGEGIIDDTYIADNSREMDVGEMLSHIVIAPEKATIAMTAKSLALNLGCSYYISSGQSSIYGAKKLMKMIDESGINSKNIIILTLTDHDKSGHSISENIGKHFGVMEYRTLLTPEQIPPEKIDEYFDEWEDGAKAYELDILNIHQLQEVFLNAVPDHVSDEITGVHKKEELETIKARELHKAVSEDVKIKRMTKALEKLQQMIFRKEYELRDKYSEIYDEADPATVYPFNIHDVVNGNIGHSVATWR